jgi:hypothetical protein
MVSPESGWLVNSNTAGTQDDPAVAVDASGAGVIAWTDNNQDAIIARRVSGAGLTDGAEFTVYHDPSVTTGDVALGIDDAGNFTLSYLGVGGIHAIHYGADGTPGADFKVYTSLNDFQYGTRVSEADDGWSIIAWNDGNTETVAQIYDPQGNVQGPPFTVPTILTTTTLNGLEFANDGLVSVEFTQAGTTDPNDDVTNFVLYHVALPPIFKQTFSFNVALGSAAGTVVGTVSAVDPTGARVHYRIPGKSPFSVDPNTGQITVADAEALTSTAVKNYQVTIDAEDGNPYSNPVTDVTITVTEGAGTLAPIADRVIDEGGETAALLTASIPSAASLTYSAVLSGSGISPATAALLFSGNVLTVVPAAGYTGSFNVIATATDGLVSVSRTFKVTVVAPTLDVVANQSIAASGSVSLMAADASNAPLTYSATAVSLKYWLAQTYDLYEDSGGFHTNQRGASEEYLRGKGSSQGYAPQGVDYWYYILPNGDLYELTPPYSGSTLGGVKVASLGTSVYADPTLLTAAPSVAIPATLSINNNVLSIVMTAPYTGTFAVVASVNNGFDLASRAFQVTANAPAKAPTPTPSPTPTPPPVLPSVVGVVAVTHTKKGLTAITVSFSGSLDPKSAIDLMHFEALGAVTKRKKTVYSKGLWIKSAVLSGGTRVTINLAKPFKGGVQLTVRAGIVGTNGATTLGAFVVVVH